MFKRIKETGVMKKTAAFALSLVMASGAFAALPGGAALDMFSISASAAETGTYSYRGNSFSYTINGSQATITSVSKKNGLILIPDEVVTSKGRYKVTAIGDNFGKGINVTMVTVPSTVKTIGDYAFYKAKMDTLNLSINLEKVGTYFCAESDILDAHCYSKVLNNIGAHCFENYNDSRENKIIIGKKLIKYDTNKEKLDLTSFEFENVTEIANDAFVLGSGDRRVKTLKLNDRTFPLRDTYFFDARLNSIETVYYNGSELVCTDKDQVLPEQVAASKYLSGKSPFALKFANQKAKCIIESLGLTYYGVNNTSVKGRLSAAAEYRIVKKVHDHVVKNYSYDLEYRHVPYLQTFNCHTGIVCDQYASISALLIESAGVEAEVVWSGIPVEISRDEAYSIKDIDDSVHIDDSTNDYYRYDNWGAHAWNYVRIGGNWYQMDVTNDDHNNCYAYFLVTNHNFSQWDTSVGIHHNPNYPVLNKSLHTYQQGNVHEALPVCDHQIGDVDGNDFLSEDDILTLKAYLNLPHDLRIKLKEKKPLTKSEMNLVNSFTFYSYELAALFPDDAYKTMYLVSFDGKDVRINFDAIDVNFDGIVNQSDVDELERLVY